MMKEKVNQYSVDLRNGTKDERKRILKEFSEMLDRQVSFMLSFESFNGYNFWQDYIDFFMINEYQDF